MSNCLFKAGKRPALRAGRSAMGQSLSGIESLSLRHFPRNPACLRNRASTGTAVHVRSWRIRNTNCSPAIQEFAPCIFRRRGLRKAGLSRRRSSIPTRATSSACSTRNRLRRSRTSARRCRPEPAPRQAAVSATFGRKGSAGIVQSFSGSPASSAPISRSQMRRSKIGFASVWARFSGPRPRTGPWPTCVT